MKVLRAGIIGCGGVARRHAINLSQLESVELIGFCDRAPERAKQFNTEYASGKGHVFEDYKRMFEKESLDLVYICLPPFAHTNEVKLACEYGIHIFIEKPIALTMELAQSMADDVQRSGVKSQVGFMWRHGEAIRWLKEYICDHRIAGSGMMIAQYYCNALHAPWWRDRSKSGGQLVEQIIHTVDLTRFYLGKPVRVYSAQENLFHRDVPDYTVEDASGTVIRFESGGLAVVVGSNGAIPRRWESKVKVILPGLTADFEDANHAVFYHTRGPWLSQTGIESAGNVYMAETLDLLGAIEEARPTAVPIEEGVHSLRLALAATESAMRDMPVDIIE